MLIKRRILTAGTTFFLAAATGHLMQNGSALSARFMPGSAPPAPDAAAAPAEAVPAVATVTQPAVTAAAKLEHVEVVSLSAAEGPGSLPALPDLPGSAAPVLAKAAPLGPRMVAVDHPSEPVQLGDYSAFGVPCGDPVMVLSAQPGGMIGLDLTAPCRPGTRVEVRQGPLVFDTVTDGSGTLAVDIPALSPSATVEVRVGDAGVTGRIEVPEAAGLQRIGVQWTGLRPLALDVYEDGAAWGQEGHASAGSAEEAKGRVIVLGEPNLPQPKLAQVYVAGPGVGSLAVEISAEVNAQNCGRTLSGAVLRGASAGAGSAEPVSLSVPACDSLGGYVVAGISPDAAPAPVAVAAKAD